MIRSRKSGRAAAFLTVPQTGGSGVGTVRTHPPTLEDTSVTRRSFSPSRVAASTLAPAIVMTLLLSGCSGDDDGASPSAGKTSSEQPAPTDPAALLDQGLKAQAQGDNAAAKATFEQLVARDATNKLGFYNLGVIAQQAGDAAQAEARFRKTIELDPKYGPALYNLAILADTKGSTDEAVDLYRRAVTANPKDASAHFNLGLLLQRLGKTEEGVKEINTAIKLNPKLKAPLPAASTEPSPAG